MLDASEWFACLRVRLPHRHHHLFLFLGCPPSDPLFCRLVFLLELLRAVRSIVPPLLQSFLHLLGFQMHLWLLRRSSLVLQVNVIEVRGASRILRFLPQLELEEGVTVRAQVPDHVLLQKEVVRGRQMVVLVVLDRFQQTFSVEALLRFEVADYLLV